MSNSPFDPWKMDARISLVLGVVVLILAIVLTYDALTNKATPAGHDVKRTPAAAAAPHRSGVL